MSVISIEAANTNRSADAATRTVVRPDGALSLDALRNSLELGLSRLIAQGQSADARAGMILSTNIAMQGALVAAVSSVKMPGLPWWTIVCTGLAFLGGVISVAAVAYAAVPRAARANESVIYFGAIAKLPLRGYEGTMRLISVEAYINDLLAQSHAVGQLVERKFRTVRFAFLLLFVTIAPWMGSVAGISKHF